MNKVAGDSILNTWGEEPYPTYERLRSQGKVKWDSRLKAWVAVDYEALRQVYRTDKKVFRKFAERVADADWYRISGDRDVMFLRGEDHTRFHRYWLTFFSPQAVAAWRDTKIRPIIDRAVQSFSSRGRAELFSQLAEQVSFRTMMSVCGLDWQSHDLYERCKTAIDDRTAWTEVRQQAPDPAVAETAARSIESLKEVLRPIIQQRKAAPTGEDLISRIWRDGVRMFSDWDEDDTFYAVVFMLFAGSANTALTMSSALYVLATHPLLAERLRQQGADSVERFTEEALRLYGSSQFVARLANQDTVLGEASVRKDEGVFCIKAAGNRDPQRWPPPEEVDLENASRDHLAFSLGPHTCAGAALARAEIQMVVGSIVAEFPRLRLDPEAEPPRFTGKAIRGYRPLNVSF